MGIRSHSFKGSKHSTDLLYDFTVIDVETTGLSPYVNAIIQLSAVRYLDHAEVDSFSSYVNPLHPIPQKITRLTGISDAMVADAPTFDMVADSFFDFISQSPVVTGYNVTFDLRFISAAAGFQVQERYHFFDTLRLARQVYNGLDNYKLHTVSSHIGYTTTFHDALNDCRACGAVLNDLCERTFIRKLDYIGPLSERSSQHLEHLKAYQARQNSNDCPIDYERIPGNGPLTGKSIVFTGALSFGRSVAEDMAEHAGAIVRGSVSKKTNYLVVGDLDTELVGEDGISTKVKRAYQLIDEYGAHIGVIGEVEFLQLLTGQEEATTRG